MVDFQAVHALVSASWSLSRSDFPWSLGSQRTLLGLSLDATTVGFLQMDGAWQGKRAWELRVLASLAQGLPVDALRPVVARWVAAHLPSNLLTMAIDRPLQASPNDEGSWYRYQKLGRLVGFLEATVRVGDPLSVLLCVEGFVKDSGQRWLKVAGGPKAKVLEACAHARPLEAWEVCAEFGSFVGYTAVRLGWRFARPWPQEWKYSCAMSTEVDAVHACVAAHTVDLARLGTATEVVVGQIPWVAPRYVEQFGWRGAGFIFMDHKGTRFHDDVNHDRMLWLLAPSSQVLSDNVLKPGAPDYLWEEHTVPLTPSEGSVVWLLHEFLEPDTEDWQALLRC